MSTVVMSACWPLQMPPTAKAVLISLADNANDHGECWPSIPTICLRTCFSERAVHRAIRWLEQSGVLTADRENGRHTRYLITPEQFTNPDMNTEPPQMRHPRISGTTADAAVQPPQMRQEPPQMRQSPPSEVRSNRKEPTRTIKSNGRAPAGAEFLTDVDPKIARDFLAVRKAKRLPLTETAAAGLRTEAEKAGLTLEQALEICCLRGWGGFNANWLGKGVAAKSSDTQGTGAPGGGRKRLA